MAKTILIDSGAIVAALSRRDQHHAWAQSNFEALSAPCLTCEAILSEVYFLLERAGRGKETVCGLLERGVIETQFSLKQNRMETLRLIRRYKETPMSFADACLVRMSELYEDSLVFTTDRDFETYRRNGRQVIPLITPW